MAWKYDFDFNAKFNCGTVLTKPGTKYKAAIPIFYNRDTAPQADTTFPDQAVVPDVSMHEYNNIALYPRHVIISRDSFGLCPITFKKHRHHKHGGVTHLGDDLYTLRSKALESSLLHKVNAPCYFGDTEYPGIYGHDLLEVIASAWAWKSASPGTKFITSTRRSKHLITMLSSLGIAENDIIFFDAPLSVEKMLFPEPTVKLRRYFHPTAQETFDIIGNRLYKSGAPTSERIYVSRSKITERPLVNELRIEAMFKKHGFTIIHPQEFSIEEQIKLFRNAKWLAGTGGSAMHNAVFARADARILILASEGWLTIADALIDQGRQRLGYVIGSPLDFNGKRSKSAWAIPEAEVQKAIELHFMSNYTASTAESSAGTLTHRYAET